MAAAAAATFVSPALSIQSSSDSSPLKPFADENECQDCCCCYLPVVGMQKKLDNVRWWMYNRASKTFLSVCNVLNSKVLKGLHRKCNKNKNCKVKSKGQKGGFNFSYDPLSYSQNFDEGCWKEHQVYLTLQRQIPHHDR